MQVSTGVTLRENNLKEIKGGRIMNSQGVLVGNAAALRENPELLAVVHELMERLEVRHAAHRLPGVLKPCRCNRNMCCVISPF